MKNALLQITSIKIKNLFLFLSLLLLLSCSEKKNDRNIFIEGTYTGGNGKMIKLSEMKTDRILDVDSAVVQNNHFRLSANTSETAYFLLQFGDDLPITLVLSPDENVTIDFDKVDRGIKYHLEGNDDSRLLMEYFNKTGQVRKQLDSLRRVLFESRAKPDFHKIKPVIDATLDSLINDHKSFTRNLIESHPSSPAAILLINKSFSGTQLFNLNDNLDLFQLIDDSLFAAKPANSHVALHRRRVSAALEKIEQQVQAEKRVSPGATVPPIKLHNPEGKLKSLQELQGQTTLLFFWASWSPESRADLQLLKEMYQEPGFHDFEVFAVSLDHREQYWKASLDVENTTWVNVNEPSGLGGSLARLFNLPPKLPYYFVIDPQGIIQLKTDRFSVAKKHLHNHN